MKKNDPATLLIHRIAAVVGHELRNPLAVINNSAYFLKAKLGPGAEPKVAKHLSIIESEIARADRLISDIVAYSRPLELRLSQFSLNGLLRELIDEYESVPGRKVGRELCPGELSIQGDKGALEEALRKLLDNAFDAADAAGKVSVSTAAGPAGPVVAVSDTGPGIDPKVRETLFDPFVTTKPRGLGLGLASALKAVAAHHGTLTLQDRAGGGTVAIAALPSKQGA